MINKNYQRTYAKPVKCPPAAPICADCGPPKHPCPQGVIFNCCTGAGLSPVVIGTAINGLFLDTPVSLVCAALDTTCLCKPMVTVEFNCIVSNFFLAGIEGTSLTFQLKKSCDNGQEVVCGTWTMTRPFVFGTATSNSEDFGFAFCDCNPCPGCCTYFVELISAESVGAKMSIQTPTLKVRATDTCADRKSDYFRDVLSCAGGEHGHPCPQGAIFNCCTGAGIQPTSICPAVPCSLVCVPIDTTCLCKPLVVLDFSAVITSTDLTGQFFVLTFQVKKTCDNGQEIECGSWSVTRAFTLDITLSDSFRFTFCDCSPCPACCTYAVELISCTVAGFTPAGTTATFSISAPTASVLAVDTCPQ